MSLSWLGSLVQGAGTAYDYLTPGKGSSTLTNAGRAIKDPNLVYTGTLNPIKAFTDNVSGFTQVQQPHVLSHNTSINQNDQSNPQVLGDNTQLTIDNTDSGTGTGYANGYTAADVSSLQASIERNNRLLESLGASKAAALQNVDAEYTKNHDRIIQDQAVNTRDLNIRSQNNLDDRSNAFNRINDNTARTYNNTMRFLGVHGAGKSSTAEQVVPTLISQEASGQRGDQLRTFNKNNDAITLSRNDSERKYRNLLDDLMSWKNSTRNSTEQSFINNDNSILGDIATAQSQLAAANNGDPRQALADYNAKFSHNQATLDQLIKDSITPTYNYQAVNTAAPDTSAYTVDPAALATGATTADPTAVDLNTYLPWLKKQQELGLV